MPFAMKKESSFGGGVKGPPILVAMLEGLGVQIPESVLDGAQPCYVVSPMGKTAFDKAVAGAPPPFLVQAQRVGLLDGRVRIVVRDDVPEHALLLVYANNDAMIEEAVARAKGEIYGDVNTTSDDEGNFVHVLGGTVIFAMMQALLGAMERYPKPEVLGAVHACFCFSVETRIQFDEECKTAPKDTLAFFQRMGIDTPRFPIHLRADVPPGVVAFYMLSDESELDAVIAEENAKRGYVPGALS